MNVNNQGYIYTITALANANDPKADWNERCFGYFFTEKEARDAVDNNKGSLSENYYTWLVVEKIEPGIHRHAKVVMWYHWDENADCWVESATIPGHLMYYINFAIG